MSFAPLELLRAWRSSRVLDDRAQGSCDREHSVVHAMLSDPGTAPRHDAPEGLRARVAQHMESQRLASFDLSAAPRRLSWWEKPLVAGVLVLALAAVWGVRVLTAPTPGALAPTQPVAAARDHKVHTVMTTSDTGALADGGATDPRGLTGAQAMPRENMIQRWSSRLPVSREARELAEQARVVRDAMLSRLPVRPLDDGN